MILPRYTVATIAWSMLQSILKTGADIFSGVQVDTMSADVMTSVNPRLPRVMISTTCGILLSVTERKRKHIDMSQQNKSA